MADKKKWTKQQAEEVWYNTFITAKSAHDAWGRDIFQEEYGRHSEFGWVIDHINPTSNGGGDEMDNLQPLHWKSNQEKGDKKGCKRNEKC